MTLLSSIDISFIENVNLSDRKKFILTVSTNEGVKDVQFLRILYLSISNDILDMEEDEIAVVDVSHEYREIEEKDVSYYLFDLDAQSMINRKFHIIKIHGSTIIDIICEDLALKVRS
ncbi:hypothetical protein BTJ40_16585 [Microbulbifer sp. A4B17]|uniref:hypothetical protein n=1 Tax=unclassified Microbulbifer TaxID=2619833 RepID=UPI000D52DF6D|nr:hypothetical protein [Microbulbifer sp. A4B17]AWF82313.1 hypothetical protein BTJ40_16585 [Microbulbifer sp. A4B17]